MNDEIHELLKAGPSARYFHVDEGGVYAVFRGLDPDRVPCLVAKGMNTRTEYRSTANDVKLTGRVRRQTGLGLGRRGVLVLDTGEGVKRFPGVLHGA